MRGFWFVVGMVALAGCAATQEGIAPPDARQTMSQEPADAPPAAIVPDAPPPPADAPILVDAPAPPAVDAAPPPPPVDAPFTVDAAPPPPADASLAPPPPADAPVVIIVDAPLPPPPPAPDAPPPPPPPPDANLPDACVPNPLGELCNGVDDTCDGVADEGFDVGAPCSNGLLGPCAASGVKVCNTDGSGTLCNAVGPEPAPFDVCGNGIDDDCDGKIDNGFPDWLTICFNGVGDCKQPGIWVCNAAGDGLLCNAVPGQPGPELCGTGHDENCDGNIDEGFPDLGQECSVGVGHCKANGTVICDPTDLTKTTCSAVPNDPEPESCNGVDDNCDGHIDEGDPGSGASCTTGAAGECGPGHLHCVEGKLACVPDHLPAPEVCDGKDNDCDGVVDNGFDIGGACNSTFPTDFCPNGHWVCNGLHDHLCVGDTPTPEVCDGKDNDCDGQVDENWDFFNDPNNCGGCFHVCSGLHADVRACTGGVCNPTCSFGWQSCDGNLDNGCEGLRNTFAGALPNPTSTLASVSGDEGQAPFVLQGYGETQVRIHVREDSSGFSDLHAQFRLQNPDGVAFHLCVYSIGDDCHTSNFACDSPGGDQSIWASADESPSIPFLDCTDDSFDVNVAISFDDANRSSCGLWTLTVYSNSDPADGSPNIDVD